MTAEPGPHVSEKVYAYITQGDQLLVFRQIDAPKAGIQVPGGTVDAGELLPEAVLREAFEETGVADLEIVAALGAAWFDLAAHGYADEVHHRHFFHLRAATPLPATWQHEERHRSDGGPPILFTFFWMPIAEASALLIAEMGALAHRLDPDHPDGPSATS